MSQILRGVHCARNNSKKVEGGGRAYAGTENPEANISMAYLIILLAVLDLRGEFLLMKFIFVAITLFELDGPDEGRIFSTYVCPRCLLFVH